MAIKFTMTDEAHARGLKFFIYGESGVGKTYAVRTLLDIGSPVIISAEGGTLSVRDVSIPVIEVSSVEDVREAYRFVRDSDDAKGFDWVYIDSLSEICELVLSDEKQKTSDPRQAYGAVIDHGTEIVRAFRDIDRNVVMTGKLAKQKDELSGRVLYMPSFPGSKLAQAIPYLFDEVFALRAFSDDDGVRRGLMTQGDGQWIAKDRSGALGAIEPVDLAHIASKIAG